MKLLIFTVLLGFNFTVQAETKEAFELAKSKVIERINKKINNLNKHLTCVQAAQDKDALKKCREENKAMHKEMKKERKEMRKEMRKKMREMKKQENTMN